MKISDPAGILIKNEPSLFKLISEWVNETEKDSVTYICAGHFMLVPDEKTGNLKAAIFSNQDMNKQDNMQQAIGLFPAYTWKMGCTILSELKEQGKKGKISLLVNDWQLVPADPDREESRPNRYRDKFYEDFKELPPIYQEEFNRHQLEERDIFKNKGGEFFLREVRLRDRFMRKIKKDTAEKGAGIKQLSCIDSDPCGDLFYTRKNREPYSLTINSKAGCAAGVSQMIIDISHREHEQGSVRKINFINLMPNGCTIPVNTASELAIDILKNELPCYLISVTNIFFEGHGTVSEENFYEDYGKSVSCFSFFAE